MMVLAPTNPPSFAGRSHFAQLASFFLLSLAFASPFSRTLRAAENPSLSPNQKVVVSLIGLPSEVALGEPFHFQVRADSIEPAHQIALEAAQIDKGPLRLLSIEQGRKSKSGIKTEYLFRIDAVMLEFGKQTIPSLTVTYRNAKGEMQKAHTDPSTITVKSYLEALSRPGEIAAKTPSPPFMWPVSKWVWAASSLTIAALLALGAYGLWRIKRSHRHIQSMHSTTQVLSPDEEALQALSELELSGMVDRQEAKAYYSRLSEILRRYLGRRFQMDALEMTSMELLENMHRLGLSPDLIQAMRRYLDEADSAKFARFIPSLPNRVHALHGVRDIVIATRLTAQESPASIAGASPISQLGGSSP